MLTKEVNCRVIDGDVGITETKPGLEVFLLIEGVCLGGGGAFS